METKKVLLTAALTGLMSGVGVVSSTAYAGGGKGQCHGVNSCKGKGACHGATHTCGGKNGCEGKGWLSMTEKECNKAILKAAAKKGMKFKKN